MTSRVSGESFTRDRHTDTQTDTVWSIVILSESLRTFKKRRRRRRRRRIKAHPCINCMHPGRHRWHILVSMIAVYSRSDTVHWPRTWFKNERRIHNIVVVGQSSGVIWSDLQLPLQGKIKDCCVLYCESDVVFASFSLHMEIMILSRSYVTSFHESIFATFEILTQ